MNSYCPTQKSGGLQNSSNWLILFVIECTFALLNLSPPQDDGSISGTQSTYINMATGHSPLDRIGSADAIIGGWWKVGYQVREARTAPRETRHVAADALDDSVHSSQSDGSNDDNPEQEAAAPATALPSKGSGGSKTVCGLGDACFPMPCGLDWCGPGQGQGYGVGVLVQAGTDRHDT